MFLYLRHMLVVRDDFMYYFLFFTISLNCVAKKDSRLQFYWYNNVYTVFNNTHIIGQFQSQACCTCITRIQNHEYKIIKIKLGDTVLLWYGFFSLTGSSSLPGVWWCALGMFLGCVHICMQVTEALTPTSVLPQSLFVKKNVSHERPYLAEESLSSMRSDINKWDMGLWVSPQKYQSHKVYHTGEIYCKQQMCIIFQTSPKAHTQFWA